MAGRQRDRINQTEEFHITSRATRTNLEATTGQMEIISKELQGK